MPGAGAPRIHVDDGNFMSANVRSDVVGGLISAVIWMIISTLVGLSSAAVVVGGLAFLVGTSLVTIAISTIISKQHVAN